MGKKEEKEIKEAIQAKSEDKEVKEKAEVCDESVDVVPEEDKVAELTEDLKRVQAEFENYKKRCEKENSSFREYAKADLIKKLLTIVDSFEIALKNHGDHEKFVKGMELIYSQLYSILKDEGLEPIGCMGKKFDPYMHEVMLTESSDEEDETIIEELQKGYKLKGSVLRHSKVKVSKND